MGNSETFVALISAHCNGWSHIYYIADMWVPLTVQHGSLQEFLETSSRVLFDFPGVVLFSLSLAEEAGHSVHVFDDSGVMVFIRCH